MLCNPKELIQVRHISLYVFGSEGLYVCHDCEMKLVEFCRSLSSESMRLKIQAHKTAILS